MANERFQYLFNRYMVDQLSELDEQDWQAMLEADDFSSFIQSDIEAYMMRYLTQDWAKKELLDATWQKITAAIDKK